MDGAGDWGTIESDPGIFTLLIRKFGAFGVQFEEIWSLEGQMFEQLRPIHGLIFLFKYIQHEEPSGTVVPYDKVKHVYFAKQVINNACATQAIISLLMNVDDDDVILGRELSALKEFSMSFDPRMRGLALSNSQVVRAAHNSMVQQSLIELDHSMPHKEEDAYHFVGYLPIAGRLYELDGLREGPIDHGPVAPGQDWIEVVRPIILRRMNVYTEGEIHFNLMAMVADRRIVYERQMDEMMESLQLIQMPPADIHNEVRHLRLLMKYEDTKRRKYAQEQVRRRHNYMPFIMCLLKILAQEKKLSPMFERAKERAAKRGHKRQKT